MFNKLRKFLKSKIAVGSVATAIKVGTACVLGAAVLVGGVALTNDVVLPNTSDKVNNVAEYEGGQLNGEALTAYVSPFQSGFNGLTQDILTVPSYFYYGDYKYTRNGSADSYTWKVSLNTSYTGTNEDYTFGLDVTKTDKNQSSYGDILESAFGYPVIDMSNAFYTCGKLTTAPTIPNSIINMDSTFFYCSSLISAPIIPNGVTNMYNTFYGCGDLKTYVGSVDADGDFSHYIIPGTVTDMYQTFARCTSLTTAPTILSGIEVLDKTFYDCAFTDLSSFVIPNSVTSLESTFHSCSSLRVAPTIPNSIRSMKSTFSSCSSLTSAPIIPYGVISMNGTFTNCVSLTTAPIIPSSVEIMSSAFSSCRALKTYVDSTDANGDFSHYAIPSNVTKLNGTFSGCNSITKVPVIPSGVTNISCIFYNCKNIKTYAGSTDADGDFSNYIIPSSVTDMHQSFSYSPIVVAPSIPNSIINIESAFENCTSLTAAPTIPNSVTNMAKAFQNCSSLAGTIEINANPEQYGGCLRNTQITEVVGSTTLTLEQLQTQYIDSDPGWF